jgi:hypothetical protein
LIEYISEQAAAKKDRNGNAIDALPAYTIGQLMLLPNNLEELIVFDHLVRVVNTLNKFSGNPGMVLLVY